MGDDIGNWELKARSPTWKRYETLYHYYFYTRTEAEKQAQEDIRKHCEVTSWKLVKAKG